MNLNRLAYFTAVVDTGSFTRAAERLGISKAVVSQQVARLEEEIGTTLLVRTTRKVYPTEAGRAFHARCAFILREAEDAFGELGQALSTPTGRCGSRLHSTTESRASCLPSLRSPANIPHATSIFHWATGA